MRWPWRRRKGHPSEDAAASASQAQRALKDTERLAQRVDEVAAQLDRIRERNHFAAAVTRAIQGR